MGAWTVTPHIAARIKHYRDRPKPLSYESIALIVGVDKRTVMRCVKRGYTPSLEAYRKRVAKQMPENYLELVGRHVAAELIEMLGVSQRTLTKWNARLGIKIDLHRTTRGKPARNRIAIPEGFRAYYEANGRTATLAHFGLGRCVMHRLVHATGGPLHKRRSRKMAEPAKPANDVMAPPPGYDAVKRKLPPVRSIYEVAA